MPSIDNDDWSDSDDEALSEVETSVLLGIPDGPVDASSSSELLDAAVSRIGGKPAFLSADIPFDSSSCKICDKPMELLVQMWCPFEDSAYDRALYVWGCARGACQRREGTVRAWRGLRLNEEYAAKLERKKKARTPAPAPPPEPKSKINPFAMGGNGAGPFGGGLGAQLFGGEAEEPPAQPEAKEPAAPEDRDDDDDEGAASDAESSSSASSLVVALASTTLEDSPWADAPTYPPQYLSTVSEYITPVKEKKNSKTTEDALTDEQDAKGAWTAEKYENSLDTDRVFDRFNTRVAAEAEQCVRYELDGVPLPFATDDVFKRLFPAPGQKAGVTQVSGAVFNAGIDEARRSYDASSVPACPLCGGKRVFECQLMPNLINVVREKAAGAEEDKSLTEEERRQAVEKLIKGGADDVRGMEWGTAMVFSCEKDCCKEKSGWTEELVLVQWDN